MNKIELRRRTRKLSGHNSPDLVTDVEVDETVDEALAELLTLDDWPFLYATDELTTVVGQDEYDLPTALRLVSGVKIPTEARLQPTTLSEIDRVDDGTDGTPTHYCHVDEETLRLWPTPDEVVTLTVRGYSHHAGLSENSDEPPFESEFHPLVAYVAASRLLAQEGDDSGRRDMYEQEAAGLLARMTRRYLTTHDQGLFVFGGGRQRRPRRKF